MHSRLCRHFVSCDLAGVRTKSEQIQEKKKDKLYCVDAANFKYVLCCSELHCNVCFVKTETIKSLNLKLSKTLSRRYLCHHLKKFGLCIKTSHHMIHKTEIIRLKYWIEAITSPGQMALITVDCRH